MSNATIRMWSNRFAAAGRWIGSSVVVGLQKLKAIIGIALIMCVLAGAGYLFVKLLQWQSGRRPSLEVINNVYSKPFASPVDATDIRVYMTYNPPEGDLHPKFVACMKGGIAEALDQEEPFVIRELRKIHLNCVNEANKASAPIVREQNKQQLLKAVR